MAERYEKITINKYNTAGDEYVTSSNNIYQINDINDDLNNIVINNNYEFIDDNNLNAEDIEYCFNNRYINYKGKTLTFFSDDIIYEVLSDGTLNSFKTLSSNLQPVYNVSLFNEDIVVINSDGLYSIKNVLTTPLLTYHGLIDSDILQTIISTDKYIYGYRRYENQNLTQIYRINKDYSYSKYAEISDGTTQDMIYHQGFLYCITRSGYIYRVYDDNTSDTILTFNTSYEYKMGNRSANLISVGNFIYYTVSLLDKVYIYRIENDMNYLIREIPISYDFQGARLQKLSNNELYLLIYSNELDTEGYVPLVKEIYKIKLNGDYLKYLNISSNSTISELRYVNGQLFLLGWTSYLFPSIGIPNGIKINGEIISSNYIIDQHIPKAIILNHDPLPTGTSIQLFVRFDSSTTWGSALINSNISNSTRSQYIFPKSSNTKKNYLQFRILLNSNTAKTLSPRNPIVNYLYINGSLIDSQ